MATTMRMSDIRAKFPMYGDIGDDELLAAVHQRYYPDIPRGQFFGAVDRDTERQRQRQALLDEMGWGGQFAAGVGMSFDKLARTARRVLDPSYTREQAEADAEIDKPLADSSGGFWGGLTGDVAMTAVPGLRVAQGATRGLQAASALLPKALGATSRVATPYAAAAAGGAAVGAATRPDDLSGGAGEGAVLGAAGEAGGRVLSSAYGGAKAVLEPLYEQGRRRVLKRTLERFATDPKAATRAAANAGELVPGVTPTLAEATMDPGLAQLQRGAAAASPNVAADLAGANQRRVQGYKDVLDDLAGTDGRREFFEHARETAAQANYGRAYAEGLQMTPELLEQSATLMQRPSIQAAMQQARSLAREKGIDLGASPEGSVAGLHWIKKALDDQIGAARTAGNTTLAQAVKGTQDELVGLLQQASPAYGRALAQYAADSAPLNQMAVGQKLRDTLVPPLGDFNENVARTRGDQYAKALREGAKTARSATGLRSATLEGTLDAQQLANVRGVASDQARYTAAQELGRVPGSPTAQYLGAQNVIRQFLGPLGIPQSAADTMVGRIASSLLSLPFKLTQSQTEELLGRALTDPRLAVELLQTPDPTPILQRLVQPYAAQAAVQLGTNN